MRSPLPVLLRFVHKINDFERHRGLLEERHREPRILARWPCWPMWGPLSAPPSAPGWLTTTKTMSIDVSHFQVGPGPPPAAFCPPFGGQAFPGGPQGTRRGDSSISSGSWGADTDCGSTGSPLSLAGFQGALDRACSAPVHLQAMRMASLSLEDASFLERVSQRGSCAMGMSRHAPWSAWGLRHRSSD